MHKGFLVLGTVLILVALLLTTFYLLPNIWNPSSYKGTPDDTEHEVEQYVDLRLNSYQKSGKWIRDYITDLPMYEAFLTYNVLNSGTAIAEDVQVTISIDGAVFNQFSLISLSPYNSFTDEFSISVNYDASKQVSLTASTQGSSHSDSLIVGAVLPRSFNSKTAKLYITPDDPLIEQTLRDILRNPFIPDWIEIRDWVGNSIKYRHDSTSHGVTEYWQLPRETLSLRTGDCEDFSILLTTLYRAIGWDKNEVYVVLGEGHAWVKLNVDIIGWQNIEATAGGLFTIIGDFLFLSGYTAEYNFNDVYLFEV